MSTNTIEQLILFKRLFIIFGSICSLWLIIGLIFLLFQTYRYLKIKADLKFFPYNYSLKLPSPLLIPNEYSSKADNISDCDQNDDEPTSFYASVSFIAERSKFFHEHVNIISSYQRIPEEQFVLALSNTAAISNLSYSQSTLTSTNKLGKSSHLHYPACQNFAYSHSTLSLSNNNLHEKVSRSSMIGPLNHSSSSHHQFNLKRQLSQLSTNTNFSQLTNITFLPSQSSLKTTSLPIVMITDVDRLHTDIIELENFEPENDFHRTKSQ
ncbi:unnamed protein product [Rotaria socialis]|uniref:Uncharacterized protein n=1 Tax=Rotaria socialis TaxID=392032 RepID=A0A818FJ08_9BILA|nr:unnamed protein product [Rotaria socialis]CAF3364392.1 unnamed protein product [Rotaria socialis]CAF3409361.1 unnamed protein product [Rotaria socialis]CAF3475977.1 unnamed protein product [Rotaria socialis]CAF4093000.1 unnamed protein product [Rotaria socialis]